MCCSKYLTVCLFLCVTVGQHLDYTNSTISPFIQLVVTNTTIYVGGEGGIVALQKESMSEVTANETFKNNWLLLYGDDEVVQCNTNSMNVSVCRKLDVNLHYNLTMSTNMTVKITNLPTFTKVHVPQTNTDVLVIGTSSLNIKDTAYGIVSFNLTNLKLFQTEDHKRGPLNVERKGDYNLVFKSEFVHESFVYFFFQIYDKNGNYNSSRLGKMCLNFSNDNKNYSHSYEDMQLKCRHENTTFEKIEYGIIEGEHFIVAFSHEDDSVLCGYSKDEILIGYNDSRRTILVCGSEPKDTSYFEPGISLGHDNYLNCFEDGICDKENKICEELEGTFCETSYHHTITGGTGIESSKLIVHLTNTSVSTMKSFHVYDNNTFFVGTKNGRVGRITPQTDIVNFRTVDTKEVISIQADQENIYVMTSNKVEKIEFENCSFYETCELCMTSFNPFCGWNYRNNGCDASGQTDDWWWIPAVELPCTKIIKIPEEVMTETDMTLKTKMVFEIEGPPKIVRRIYDTENSTCNVNNLTHSLERTKSYCEFMLSLPNDKYKLEIIVEGIVVASKMIFFYNCPNGLTCTECAGLTKCFWGLMEAKCTKNGGGGKTIVITDEAKCPKLTNESIKLYAGISYVNVTVHGLKNITSSDLVNISCVIQNDTVIYNVPSTAWGDNLEIISCTEVTLPEPKTGLMNYTLRLKYRNVYFGNEVSLHVYTCNSLLYGVHDCGECNQYNSMGYECEWCHGNQSCQHFQTESCSIEGPPICNITLYKVYPASGPKRGGTSVTMTGTSFESKNINNTIVTIGGQNCTNVFVKENYTLLECITGEVLNPLKENISITLDGEEFSFPGGPFYEYKDPKLDYFHPDKGIIFGGIEVTLNGSSIVFREQAEERYQINFCNDSGTCIPCRVFDCCKTNYTVTCRTGNTSEPQNTTYVEVQIDRLTTLNLTKQFRFLQNPTFNLSSESQPVQKGGGVGITIKGEGFNNVGAVTVEKDEYKKDCNVTSDSEVTCETPEFNGGNENQTIHVNFDGLTKEINIQYVPNPAFDKFGGILEYEDKESTISLTGSNLLRGASNDDYRVNIGLDGKCTITAISMEDLSCLPPRYPPRTTNADQNVVMVEVYVGKLHFKIGDMKYVDGPNVLAIIVGVLAAALVSAVIAGVSVALILKKKKKKAITAFKMELISREEMIRKASREEFADAQITIRDIKSDLVTTKVPYCDYQRYVFQQLFPNQDIKTHPLLLSSTITDDGKIKIQTAMDMFDKLLTNKLFLKSLVQTLDRQNRLTVKEKANFASLLSVALIGNMRLFYDLVNCLLVDNIRSVGKKQQKVLFRRFESISQRLLANWLQIVLYTQLTSQSGLQLFMLYKAVQTVIEKAPVDALTGNSRNTLAEEKLLKMRVECEPLTLQIDLNGNSDQHYPVKVLDCDTITQVKQKCCLQIYKYKHASEIPHMDELTLEWREGTSGKQALDDIDTISERNNGLVRLNTLKHYMVKDNSKMALMYKEHTSEDIYENNPAYRHESVSSEDVNLLIPDREEDLTKDTQRWHLECSASNLPDDIKSNREQDIGDIFLNRLFHTKLLLSDYIDTTFEGLLDHHFLSVPIRYFFRMLDKQGNDHVIDPEVIQLWKSECYATRLWGPLIGKPQIIFDVDVPAHVEPCMDILRQVFVESFTQTTHKVNRDSSPQKLLFHKDIPQYRKRIEPFFLRVEPVEDQEFWSALDDISTSQKNEMKFSRQATLQQLYNLFIAKYSTEIIEDFNDMEDSKDLGFGHKLEEVIENIEQSTTDS